MKGKKEEAPPETPSQTETWTHRYPNTSGRQEQSESGPLLLPSSTNKTLSRPLLDSKEGRFHKPLAPEFRAQGFDYREIAREGEAAIYEQTWRGSSKIAYEVIRIRRHDGYTIAGKHIEPAEIYPSSEQWGMYGFTLADKDTAFAKFRSLSGDRFFPTAKHTMGHREL